MGLTGTVKKNVGGALQRKKSDIRAEILKWYPDPDRPPLGEQKLDDALETRDKAAAVASLQVLSPSGFKGMKFKLNEVKQKFPEETKGVKGLGAKGYTLADFGESLIKALESHASVGAAGRGERASWRRRCPRQRRRPRRWRSSFGRRRSRPRPRRRGSRPWRSTPRRRGRAPAAPPPSPEPDFFEAVSNLFGWLAPAAAETEDAAAPPVPAPAATNWLGIPNSGVEERKDDDAAAPTPAAPPAPVAPGSPAGRRSPGASRRSARDRRRGDDLASASLARYALGSDCSPDDNEHRWRDMGARGVANVRRAARLTSAGGDLALELEADDHVDAGDEKKAKFRFLPEAVREADGRRAHRDFGVDRFLYVAVDEAASDRELRAARAPLQLAACQYRLLFSYHDRPLLVFFAEAGPGLRDVSVEAVRDAIVPPEVRRAGAARPKRLRLAFSKTLRGVDLAPDQVAYPREPIRAGDGEDAVDGLALVSRTALRESGLWSFDAVQIRFRGAKAMALAVDDAYLRENFGDGCHLALYPSAVKFRFAEAASAPLEFVSCARRRSANLSEQHVAALVARGARADDLAALADETREELVCDLADERRARRAFRGGGDDGDTAPWVLGPNMLRAGFALEEPLLQHCLRICAKQKLRGWKGDGDEDTSRIALPRSAAARLYVVADPTSSLAPGHCVVGVDDDEVKIEGPVAIMTDPTLAPEDVLVLARCRRPALLEALGRVPRGVLMLPTTARHPTAEFLCGGDYDGDTAVVLWRREIVDGLGAAPGAEALLAPPRRGRPGRRRADRRAPRAGYEFKRAVRRGHAVPGDGSLSLANFALKDFPYDATPWTPGGYDRAVGPADYAGAQASLRAKLNDVLGDLEAFDFGREPAFDPSLLDLAHGDGGDAAVRARLGAAARDAYNGDVARVPLPEGPLRNEACGKVKRDHQAKFLEAWSPVDRERAALHLAAAHDKADRPVRAPSREARDECVDVGGEALED
ncbi:RNA-dependent RNA polymerase [Aureococcus anophagefferens]|nr:RNA-dependent RNA polymerase [Aureococcus anophagefferens]